MSEKKYSIWFAKRRESTVVEGTKAHVLKIVDTCQELVNAVGAIKEKDEVKAKAALARLEQHERAADIIELSLNEELAIGELPAKEREDLMHLVKRIDHVADWTKSAGRNIDAIIDV